MNRYITNIKASGIYSRFDLDQDFDPGINIIYGKNGTGKTTFLHILANMLNGDFERFRYLDFRTIEVNLNNGNVIKVQRFSEENALVVSLNEAEIAKFPIRSPQLSFSHKDIETGGINYKISDKDALIHLYSNEFLKGNVERSESEIEKSVNFEDKLLPVAYFPAFRTMIEAWATTEENTHLGRRREHQVDATKLARRVFGAFVPTINYPSPLEIEQKLTEEIQQALLQIARMDEELLSESFINIFVALSDEIKPEDRRPETIVEEIRKLYDLLEESSSRLTSRAQSVYSRLRQLVNSKGLKENLSKIEEGAVSEILEVYKDSLKKRVEAQRDAFKFIDAYLESVNNFLEGKIIEKRFSRENRAHSLVEVKFQNGPPSRLRSLSSGERQIITLIYAATHMNRQNVVLIDEPELSLHVDWQRMLLPQMADQLGDRQIIACTHSPVIAADYEENMKELVLKPTKIG